MATCKKLVAATRSRFLQTIGFAAAGLSAFGNRRVLAAAHPVAHMSSTQALDMLMEGNRRYARDMAINCNQNFDRRAEVAGGQRPFAMILGCADSRVPPEVVFDQRLGDLFTVRIAGNVADAYALGSFEYAVLHYAPALLMVLGHEKCGAVEATLEGIAKQTAAPGHIASLVAAIKPAVESISATQSDALDAAVRANITAVVASLRKNSSILGDRIASGTLRIVGARYGLSDGRVTLVE